MFNYIYNNIIDYIQLSNIHLGIANLIEILILSLAIYLMGNWLFETNAGIVFKGILVFVAVVFLSVIFQFNTILWLLNKFTNIGVVAILIIFQADIRKAFENLGRMYSLPMVNHKKDIKSTTEKDIDEIVHACKTMSNSKTGALIVIKRKDNLNDYINTGIDINGDITHQLLINIFEHNTPLHDGAVIIDKNKIISATCYLPLTERKDINKMLGTRHRAAIGMSEERDAVVVVVSEETGEVSMAHSGDLIKYKSFSDLKNDLITILIPKEDGIKINGLRRIIQNAKK